MCAELTTAYLTDDERQPTSIDDTDCRRMVVIPQPTADNDRQQIDDRQAARTDDRRSTVDGWTLTMSDRQPSTMTEEDESDHDGRPTEIDDDDRPRPTPHAQRARRPTTDDEPTLDDGRRQRDGGGAVAVAGAAERGKDATQRDKGEKEREREAQKSGCHSTMSLDLSRALARDAVRDCVANAPRRRQRIALQGCPRPPSRACATQRRWRQAAPNRDQRLAAAPTPMALGSAQRQRRRP